MKTNAKFYHAGCPVCLSAQQALANKLDPQKYQVETIHLGQDKNRIAEAKKEGVKSVPALVLEGQTFHINFGAALSDLE